MSLPNWANQMTPSEQMIWAVAYHDKLISLRRAHGTYFKDTSAPSNQFVHSAAEYAAGVVSDLREERANFLEGFKDTDAGKMYAQMIRE